MPKLKTIFGFDLDSRVTNFISMRNRVLRFYGFGFGWFAVGILRCRKVQS